MAGTNDFQVFDPNGVNIESQANYVADTARLNGVASGTASSMLANKTWRQASAIASMIGQFIVNLTGQNAADDGTTATLLTNFELAILTLTRIKLVSNLNLYVSTTGSDSNNGLTSVTPFLTLQRAITIAYQNYDTQGFNVVINCADGTYTNGASIAAPLVGGGALSFVGNPTTPANCIIAVTNGICFSATLSANVSLNGFTLSASGSSGAVGFCLNTASSATISFQNIIFGSVGQYHIQTVSAGFITAVGNYTISGSMGGGHVNSVKSGVVSLSEFFVTLTGTLTCGSYFFSAGTSGSIETIGTAYGGSTVTGNKYQVYGAGGINSAGSGLVPASGATSQASSGYFI